MIQGFENFDFNLVEVVINNSCPLDCSYCFLQNQGTAQNMDVKTLQNVIRMCRDAQLVHRQEYISIMFALKEPMVSWNVIKEAIETLEFDPMEYDIYFTMNTNGVLLTDDHIKWCREHCLDIHVSLDGPKDIHDRGRVYRGNQTGSSFDKVYELIQKYPNFDYMSFMTTIHLQDIDRIEEIFNFMSNLPITCWVYALNKFDDWSEENIEKLEKQIKHFIDNATPAQKARTRIANTAARFPNISVKNGIKVVQDGMALLQPPTPNDGAKEGEFTSQVILGNVNTEVIIPEKYRNINYAAYEIIGPNCTDDCKLKSFCKQGDRPIYVSQFSCTRVQHFDRMSRYIKGETGMTDEEYEKIVNQQPISNIIINLTDRCNLACPYCFTDYNDRDIDLGTFKQAIMFMLNSCDKFPEFTDAPGINFFGGEPMLKYDDIIVPIMNWCEDIGLQDKYKITWGMTTNGTLLTEERCKWLREHNVNILLSIDGDKFTQDDQRPTKGGGSSFDLLIKNIPHILHYWPYVTFRSAIEPRNVKYMYENYKFARDMGFRNYFITPNVSATWSVEDIQEACHQLTYIAMTMLRDYKMGYEPCCWNEMLVYLKEFLAKKEPFKQVNYHHCGIGTHSAGISVDGTINGCQEHNTYMEHDIFAIGNVFTGIDKVKHKRLLEEYGFNGHPVCKERPELCDSCQFYDTCAFHYCPSHNLNNDRHGTENSLVTCLWKKYCYDLAGIIWEMIADMNDPALTEKITSVMNKAEFSLW